MRARHAGLWPLLILLGACGGGGMAERDPEGATGGESTAAAADEPAGDESGSAQEPVSEIAADADAYEADLRAAVQQGWTPPGRDSSTPPRIAVVTVELGENGRLEGWSWRRRSPQGPFNDSIAEHLDGLVDSSARSFPLPPAGSELHEHVLADGVAIEFADQ